MRPGKQGVQEMGILPYSLISLAYVAAFTALDQATLAFQTHPAVTVWYPPSGLSLALLIGFGLRFAPAVALAGFISSLFTYRISAGVGPIAVWAGMQAFVYSEVAAVLRRWKGFDPRLRGRRDVLALAGTGLAGALLLAVLSSVATQGHGMAGWQAVARACLEWWTGEAIGIIVVTPFLLVHVLPALGSILGREMIGGKEDRGTQSPHRPASGPWEGLAQAAGIAAALGVVFFSGPRRLPLYYLCFLPLLWITLRRGLGGAVLTILAVDVGSVLAMSLSGAPTGDSGDLQTFMLTYSLTGLILGAIVAERSRAEAAHLDSEERYRTLVERAPEAILVFDGDSGRILSASEHAEQIFGMSRDRLAQAAMPAGLSPPLQPDGGPSSEGMSGMIRVALEGGRPVFEWMFRNGGGLEAPCEVRLVRLPDKERRLVRASAVDISLRKSLEERLRQAQKMEAIGNLAGGVAHDFNNLLTAILGYSNLAQMQEGNSPPVREALEEIQKAGERAASLTRQLLAFSRRQVIEPKILDLNAVVYDMEKMLRRLLGERIAFSAAAGASLGRIKADRG